MTKFEEIGSKVDGNAAKKVNERSNDPFSHHIRDVKPSTKLQSIYIYIYVCTYVCMYILLELNYN